MSENRRPDFIAYSVREKSENGNSEGGGKLSKMKSGQKKNGNGSGQGRWVSISY